MADTTQKEICQMFDRIAGTYDSVNRVLSWGQDLRWRNTVARALPYEGSLRVLDIATGTADLLIAMCQARANIISACGVDLSGNMLAIAQQKLREAGLEHRIKLELVDACALPFADHAFDVVTIAFGIRNVSKVNVALAQMARVLRPGGQVHILEFSLPHNYLIRFAYLAYFRYWLPWVGGLISGERQAYRYLNRTVESFAKPEEFRKLMAEAGFSDIQIRPLSFGIATLYSAGIG